MDAPQLRLGQSSCQSFSQRVPSTGLAGEATGLTWGSTCSLTWWSFSFPSPSKFCGYFFSMTWSACILVHWIICTGWRISVAHRIKLDYPHLYCTVSSKYRFTWFIDVPTDRNGCGTKRDCAFGNSVTGIAGGSILRLFSSADAYTGTSIGQNCCKAIVDDSLCIKISGFRVSFMKGLVLSCVSYSADVDVVNIVCSWSSTWCSCGSLSFSNWLVAFFFLHTVSDRSQHRSYICWFVLYRIWCM